MLKLHVLSPSRTRKSLGSHIPCPLATKWAWIRDDCAWKRRHSRLVMQWNSCSPDESQEKQLKLRAATTVRTRVRTSKKGWSQYFLSFQDQSNMDSAFMPTNEEAVVVGKAYNWSDPWQIAWEAVEIACTDYSRQGQEKSSGITIPCTLAAKWTWRQVHCAWIKSYSRSVMQRNKLLSWRIAWKAVETARSDDNGTKRKSTKGITIACPLETK